MYVQSRFSFFNRSSVSSTPCEQLFMEAHKKESAEHAGTRVILKEYYRKYLQVLWTYPFYGGAFFFGSVEPKANRLRKLIASLPLMKVNICINTDGVAVFNGQKEELLIYVPYSQLSWNYRDLPWDGDSDPLPTLMMQFLCDEQSAESPGKPVTKLLQIFSYEAKLMNALIETCVDRKLAEKNNVGKDFTDGPLDIAEKKLLNKLNKLTLETYTQDGEQLSID
ncbi:unnamed protein product [Lymnaea stagnalis]|uniref:KRIT1/FRMD8 FERM domain-containing protein n=1 Tax=Lymnaea stagnalis TaxID=6523 RepID=A0AAV2INL8_LYMST